MSELVEKQAEEGEGAEAAQPHGRCLTHQLASAWSSVTFVRKWILKGFTQNDESQHRGPSWPPVGSSQTRPSGHKQEISRYWLMALANKIFYAEILNIKFSWETADEKLDL